MNEVQIVARSERTSNSLGGAPYVTQTLVAATSMTVAAALGFARQQRRAFFIQQCLFKHVRRYLVLLQSAAWELTLIGVSPRLRSC